MVSKNQSDLGGKYQQQNMAAIEVSYLVAFRNAKAKKPHTIAEELLLQATKDIVRVMLGAEYVNKLNTISLSKNIVSRRIDDMSADIMEQVIQEMKSAPLGIFNHTLKITSLASSQSKKHLQNGLFVLPLPQQYCTIICHWHAA